ncbi:MobC family plasmid mobilization relaxosome protein [Gluconobacter oxydans]|uniref:MobC family plasmid mobilization relaxosome protein n=1 Tax=Gluconobacter oxydans TaxID=442 RepID=UPI0007816234|nr:MobC family plasmid mobilization relaxosome protein [Gluconobacter oxydans]
MQTDRLHSFRIRASRADLAAWERAAHAAGTNRTSWLRSLAAEAAATGQTPGVLADDLARLRRELAAIGNNVNQIAHHLNSGGHASPQAALDAVETAMLDVSSFLNDIRAPRRKGGSRRKVVR